MNELRILDGGMFYLSYVKNTGSWERRPSSRRSSKTASQCRRRDAQPCHQLEADLPLDRVTQYEPAFTSVGIDYFGPFAVKRGRGREKRYGCMFTCLTTRAVHIETHWIPIHSSTVYTDSWPDAGNLVFCAQITAVTLWARNESSVRK